MLNIKNLFTAGLGSLLLLPSLSQAIDFKFINEAGDALPQVMVTQTPVAKVEADLSDDGYTPNGVSNPSDTTLTHFSNANGEVTFENPDYAVQYRARAQGARRQQLGTNSYYYRERQGRWDRP